MAFVVVILGLGALFGAASIVNSFMEMRRAEARLQPIPIPIDNGDPLRVTHKKA